MQYHKITPSLFAAVMGNRPELLDWIAACGFMLAAYGERAATIEAVVEHNGYYDDENFSDCFSKIIVCDRDGFQLEPDVSLPYWRNLLTETSEYMDGEDELASGAQQRLYNHYDPPIPMKQAKYDIAHPPCDIPEFYMRVL